MKIPEYDPQTWSAATQSLVERMAKAGWLSGLQTVTLERFDVNWSTLGRQQMEKAYDVLIKTVPDFFMALDIYKLSPSDVKQPTAAQLINLFVELGPIIKPLQALSKDETLVFFSWLTYFAREKALKQPPKIGGNPGPRFKM